MVLFHNPQSRNKAIKPQYDKICWIFDESMFEAWCAGETGYPLVDAGMRELNATGYMHNRVRMVVASFLTKHLLHDWRLGEAYFAKNSLILILPAMLEVGSGLVGAGAMRLHILESLIL